MKITPLLIGACLVSAMAGCHKPSDVIVAAEAAVKTTALASITAKYPDVRSSELKFSDLRIGTEPDGKETIFVTYIIPASVTTSTEGNKATTTTKTITVGMSPLGKVESVYNSSRQDTYNVAQ